ncbi:MAG: UDP-N-acetylmuramoyl-tripeptide--D-alanyl-D-alanine ligase [Hyphomicrobium sp.]
MNAPLWTFEDLVQAAGGVAGGTAPMPLTGFSIDTRTLKPGDIFVALKDQRDGHDFVTSAFAKGAGAAIVSASYVRQTGDGALVRVADPLKGLEGVARAARSRLSPAARVIAVTGSVGKTGTKEMLKACLSLAAPGRVHAADKSFNNHWGVPLTLASMPAGTIFGVFEIGMNHAGEIAPLTRHVRPHVAIITTVEAVHLEHFASVEDIAEAKSEIFLGLEKGGVAIISHDNAHYTLMERRAREAGCTVRSFGLTAGSQVRPSRWDLGPDGSDITVTLSGREVAYRVAAPGAHIAQNSLAVVAALDAVGVHAGQASKALAEMPAPHGRGSRTVLSLQTGDMLLIDESYNANPASMRSALAAMATVPRERYGRRVAVLGDMLELGADAANLHAGLAEAIHAANVDVVFLSGPQMAHLNAVLPQDMRGGWAKNSTEIKETLLSSLAAGDAVMIKGSNGSRMAPLVEAIKEKFSANRRSQ